MNLCWDPHTDDHHLLTGDVFAIVQPAQTTGIHFSHSSSSILMKDAVACCQMLTDRISEAS
jgi:hypothetical protein